MKNIHLILYTIFLSLIKVTSPVLAQQCNNYPCVIKKVINAISTKNYQLAFDNLESAEGYPSKNVEEISTLRKRLFKAIEQEKINAFKARDEAKKQAELARAVLNSIYFYDNKFGLAFKDTMIYPFGEGALWYYPKIGQKS